MHPDVAEIVLGDLLCAIRVEDPVGPFLSLFFLDFLPTKRASEVHRPFDLVFLLGLVDLTG